MEEKPKVLIVGTFHMESTRDLYQTDIDNMFSEQRQMEINQIVTSLKEFKPTKVTVEIDKKNNEKLNKEFLDYRNGKINLQSNEVHQLGFRVAEQLGHNKIYAIDWLDETVENRSLGEVLEWARKNLPELYQEITEKYFKKFSTFSEIGNKSIVDVFKEINKTELIKKLHEAYLAVARIADDSNYVGIDWVSWWYQRNLIIYANLAAIATSKSDRTLLIIGASHVHLVAQFLRESGKFEVEELHHYLS
ncbi:hypothetical protein CIB95_04165 [Lottiidibacillus patelloidae]|uniref:Haem-binding uptake Tiki superfamily ChaN domain-containing protein n=1 Tax=Lottiidibacillus patelloidae TaxID=2670334 RepID=A0A263BUZ8_9BACI|nr:DUF5694 domain-containing protein [Lottiidibacillus patelloidae]OZM57573.1 hypothetical protein CIB95_04165 [Lottiidibacillus patelloidae]